MEKASCNLVPTMAVRIRSDLAGWAIPIGNTCESLNSRKTAEYLSDDKNMYLACWCNENKQVDSDDDNNDWLAIWIDGVWKITDPLDFDFPVSDAKQYKNALSSDELNNADPLHQEIYLKWLDYENLPF